MLDIHNFVKSLGNMKAKGIAGKFSFRVDFIFGQPTVVGESEVKFVSIVPAFIRTENGSYFRNRHFGDAFKLIHYLLRSEERRVGKECRSRWSQYSEKKK